MPSGVFPPVIESFAVSRSEQMGVDPGGLAMAALTVCAAAIPDNITLKMKRHESWKEAPRVWMMAIGDPSTRKSPLIKAASTPLLAIEAELQRDHRDAMREWFGLDKEAKKGKSEPIAKRVATEDSSPEKVGEILSNNEAGLALIDDELSGWFARMEKYSGAKGSGADRAFGSSRLAVVLIRLTALDEVRSGFRIFRLHSLAVFSRTHCVRLPRI